MARASTHIARLQLFLPDGERAGQIRWTIPLQNPNARPPLPDPTLFDPSRPLVPTRGFTVNVAEDPHRKLAIIAVNGRFDPIPADKTVPWTGPVPVPDGLPAAIDYDGAVPTGSVGCALNGDATRGVICALWGGGVPFTHTSQDRVGRLLVENDRSYLYVADEAWNVVLTLRPQ